jgi:hypothetical protein
VFRRIQQKHLVAVGSFLATSTQSLDVNGVESVLHGQLV